MRKNGRCLLFILLCILHFVDAQDSKKSSQIPVAGNKFSWTTVAKIQGPVSIKVYAEGKVDFGGRVKLPFITIKPHEDSPTAGVEGSNKVFEILHKINNAIQDVENLIATLRKINPDNPWEIPGNLRKVCGLCKDILNLEKHVNYNQGGVWIRIVDREGKELASPSLYYYWVHSFNKSTQGMYFDQDIMVQAKAHDGGKDPHSKKDYGDNTGEYKVWVEYWTYPDEWLK